MALPRYRAYARLLVDGMPSRPFSMETLPPPRIDERQGRAAIIRRPSRHRYAAAGRPRRRGNPPSLLPRRMNTPSPAPSTEDLYEFYKSLKQRVDRIDGEVKQLLAERTRGTLTTPTWRDLDAMKKDVAELEKRLPVKRNV